MSIDRSRSKRGRPPKTIGQRFATMAWFADVLRLSGAENPNQLGQLLFPKQRSGHGSNLLYRYRNGSVLPDNIDKRLKRVGPHLLASWIWFQYPLWRYLDHRQYELRDVRGLLLNFSDEINELVVHDYFEEEDSFVVTRTPEDWRHRFDRLRSIGNLDAWTGALVLLRQLQAVHLDSSEQYHYGCEAVLNMREVVYQHPTFGGFADHLYRWLAFCLHGLEYVASESSGCRSYTQTNRKITIAFTVRGLNRHWERLRNQEIACSIVSITATGCFSQSCQCDSKTISDIDRLFLKNLPSFALLNVL